MSAPAGRLPFQDFIGGYGRAYAPGRISSQARQGFPRLSVFSLSFIARSSLSTGSPPFN